MRVTRRSVWGAVAWTAAVAAAVAFRRRDGRARRALRSTTERLGVEVRHRRGQWQGLRYRLAGRGPDPNVADDILADRIRSTLGPLEHDLDIPRVHVMVEDHVALLHGDVPADHDAHRLERAVKAIPGVRGVESYLHVGLLRGDIRPSEGHAPASAARTRLLAAATGAGVAQDHAPMVVRAVLSRFCERLPEGEREHVFAHLPADVRSMLQTPRHLGHAKRVRSLADLVFLILLSTDTADLDAARSRGVVTSVLGEFRRLIPEEAADVAAVLPAELRAAWDAVAAP